jgi:hypothetical protein
MTGSVPSILIYYNNELMHSEEIYTTTWELHNIVIDSSLENKILKFKVTASNNGVLLDNISSFTYDTTSSITQTLSADSAIIETITDFSLLVDNNNKLISECNIGDMIILQQKRIYQRIKVSVGNPQTDWLEITDHYHTNRTAIDLVGSYTSTATAGGTTTLTVASNDKQRFTGITTQTVLMPVTSTLTTGRSFTFINNSTGIVTINSSGNNNIVSLSAGASIVLTCVGITLTTAADWTTSFNVSGINSGDNATPAETGTTIATIHNAATDKVTIVDADYISGMDSVTPFGLIKTTWTKAKAFLSNIIPISTSDNENYLKMTFTTGASELNYTLATWNTTNSASKFTSTTFRKLIVSDNIVCLYGASVVAVNTGNNGGGFINNSSIQTFESNIANLTFGEQAFKSSSLISISCPKSTIALPALLFNCCTSLVYVNFPLITVIGNSCFANMGISRNIKINLPNLTTRGTTTFNNTISNTIIITVPIAMNANQMILDVSAANTVTVLNTDVFYDTDIIITTNVTGQIYTKTWTSIKAFLKTYFDTVYAKVAGSSTQDFAVQQITSSGTGTNTFAGAIASYKGLVAVNDSYVSENSATLLSLYQKYNLGGSSSLIYIQDDRGYSNSVNMSGNTFHMKSYTNYIGSTGNVMLIENGIENLFKIPQIGNVSTSRNLTVNGTGTNTFAGAIGIRTATPQGTLHIGLGTYTANAYNYTTGYNTGKDGGVLNAYYSTGATYSSGRIFDIVALGDKDGSSGGGLIRFSTNSTTSYTSEERMLIDQNGLVTVNSQIKVNGTGTNTFAGTVKSTQFKLSTLNTAPTSKTAAGTIGEIKITATYIYICTVTGTEGNANWNRIALNTEAWS